MTPPPASASHPFHAVVERIGQALELVDRNMREQLESASPLIGAIGEHVLGSGGKRVRPALTLLAAELCGYTGPRRIQVGAAVELLHTASLLHDDVVDLAELRRGKPSASVVWGNRRAVLGGDFLYARASTMIVEDGNHEVLEVFADAIRSMAEGELLQLESSFDTSVTESRYFAVIERKSAMLLSCATETGSIIAGVTRGERRRLREFGRELGVAFQLRDDALDYEASEAELGKAPHADLREGKVTLPLLLALKHTTPTERDAVTDVLKAASRDALASPQGVTTDLTPALEVVDRYHGVADTVRRAEQHLARANEALAPFPDVRAKQDLLAAAHFAVLRDR
jgi:octaprenyl-diphosphate synthase